MKADTVSEESTAASITADVVEESDPTFPKIVEVTTLATDSHTPITTTAQPNDSIVTVQSLPVSNNVTSVQTLSAFTTSGEKIILPNSVLADLNKLGSGPLYLVPSTSIPSGATVVTASSSTSSSSGTVNVIPASAVQTLTVPSQQRVQVDKEGRTMQTMVKRPALSQSGQVITKVIITSNPLTGQATTQQVCLAPVLPVSSEGGGTSLGQTVKIVTQPQGLLSPTKTITLNQPTLLTSPNKQPLIAAIPGTPSKQGILLNKIAISPAKTPTKFTMIPMTVSKSPQRIAPAPAPVPIAVSSGSGIQAMTSTCATTTVTVSKPGPITVSPQKVIFRQALPTKGGTTLIGQPQVAVTVQNPSSVHTPTTSVTTTAVKQVTVPISSASNVQQIQVPGSKFHYVRLVSTPVNTTNSATKTATVVHTTNTKTIVPGTVASTLPSQNSGQMKIAVPIAPAGQQTVVSKPSGTQQRILFPASNVTALTPIRSTTGNLAVPATSLAQLPPGTTLISTGGNMQGIVMVPAQYVTQFQQLGQQSTAGQTTSTVTAAPVSTPQPILPAQTTTTSQTNFVPIAAASSGNSYDPPQQSQSTRHVNGRSTLEPNGVRPRKPCNCTKSQCLKLYCDCFANGEFCNNCNCSNCYNNLDHEEERQKAIKACLDRNPLAFHPKIGKGKDGEQERRHNKGCNCKRSGCLKNYCECYEAKIMCSSMCKCVGCKNFEESAERKTLMHLADAAEVRVQQQTAAKNKLSSQVQDVPSKPPLGTTSGERLPFSFVTPEVVQATCQCLLAQTEEGERTFLQETALEKLVLEEFGRCLVTIIDYANRTKGKGSPNVDSASGITRSGRTGPNS